MKSETNCPCGENKSYKNCCQKFHKRENQPATALECLKSRYVAFVTGEIDYIFITTHPEKQKELDRESLKAWSKESQWHGLEIHRVTIEDENTTSISFTANYTQKGRTYKHDEDSLFKREAGLWYFFDIKKNQPIKIQNHTRRNDPCFCGSQKKYKKCHGQNSLPA